MKNAFILQKNHWEGKISGVFAKIILDDEIKKSVTVIVADFLIKNIFQSTK